MCLPAMADVQINNLDDISLGAWPGFGNLIANDDLCVVNDGPRPRRYQIVALGSGPGGSFSLTNGITELDYIARYNDRSGVTGNLELQPGVALTNRRRARGRANQCPNRVNANIQIEILDVELQQATPGGYNGTLTLTITPE